MNPTISVDDETLGRARALARQRGVSLQDLLRRMLASLVGSRTANGTAGTAGTADELMGLLKTAGNSAGAPIARRDAYEGRV